jgi:hypothetical protein
MDRVNATYTILVSSSQLFKPQILYLYRNYFKDLESLQIRKTREEQ